MVLSPKLCPVACFLPALRHWLGTWGDIVTVATVEALCFSGTRGEAEVVSIDCMGMMKERSTTITAVINTATNTTAMATTTVTGMTRAWAMDTHMETCRSGCRATRS